MLLVAVIDERVQIRHDLDDDVAGADPGFEGRRAHQIGHPLPSVTFWVHAEVFRWTSAQTTTPLGQTHLWDAKAGIGVAGDWCIGHRVEDAFISGLELALDVL